MNKVSIIIPYYESDPGKPEILQRLTDSLRGYDEIIISSNVKEGYAIPINRGLRAAHGDYLVVMNDDLVLTRGEVRSLCDPNFVTSPIVSGEKQDFWGCCFCLPRWVYERIEGLDERYRISYFDDDDLMNELRNADIPMKAVEEVEVKNVDGGGRTLHTFPDHNEFFIENKQRFIDKWGYDPQTLTNYYNKNNRLPRKGEI